MTGLFRPLVIVPALFLGMVGCVHVPAEVDVTFAPRAPGEASNFDRSSRALSPVPVPAPALKASPASAPASPPAAKTPAASPGGEA